MGRRAGTLLAGCLLVADCGQERIGADLDDVPPGRYRVTTTVIEAPGQGPQLCASVQLSHPPQCDGDEIAGWSWDTVAHEAAAGVRWGDYRLVGTFDGDTFTLTEPARVAAPSDLPTGETQDLTSPCAPPAGGWRVVDPRRTSIDALDAAAAEAEDMAGFGGLWIDQNGGVNDVDRLVLNIRFTGDPVTREAALRAHWGGALCLSPARHAWTVLERAQADLAGAPGVLDCAADPLDNHVKLTVEVVTPETQDALDRRFGPGVVEVSGWLEPV